MTILAETQLYRLRVNHNPHGITTIRQDNNEIKISDVHDLVELRNYLDEVIMSYGG